MAIGSEFFGKYVEEMNVTVEHKNGDGWLCCVWKYVSLFWGGRVAQDWRNRWVMVPGIGGLLRLALSMVRQ